MRDCVSPKPDGLSGTGRATAANDSNRPRTMHRITRTATRSLWKNSTRFVNTFLAVIGQRRRITSLLRQLWDFERPFPAGIEVLYNPPNAVVDIIFVHGLTGDRIKTWTAHGASEPWPKTLLPEKIPNARILTVGYDANVVGLFGAVSQNSIGNHAENLLSHVASKIDGKVKARVTFHTSPASVTALTLTLVEQSAGLLRLPQLGWSGLSRGSEPVSQESAFTPPRCPSIDPRHRFPRDTAFRGKSCYACDAFGLAPWDFQVGKRQDSGLPQRGFRSASGD
ncbi:uncharacterized protein B0T15DRAFT_282738 [Chaetomium strumarium]|uniref:Uncharacterized protein n=1 Tax=Chaetomium strumarium TaxID=1170767 RepID=A0AAJ0GPG5_9PEZI|nr:hypothetical protein B0T15DRAFT_282738 [Chaetomium strumarium]